MRPLPNCFGRLFYSVSVVLSVSSFVTVSAVILGPIVVLVTELNAFECLY